MGLSRKLYRHTPEDRERVTNQRLNNIEEAVKKLKEVNRLINTMPLDHPDYRKTNYEINRQTNEINSQIAQIKKLYGY